MKNIHFQSHVLPHALAVIVFVLVTVFFFNPIFFQNKTLDQHDINQSIGTAKALRDYRDQTGEEGLWAPNLFSGMPGYLVNVEWSYEPVSVLKDVLSVGLPHPVRNIFLAFLSYYIMLLVFGVRPYLAIAGAVAFGLSSYMMIGIMAGHNARIGAIAFMPMVIAGVHLVFQRKWIIGFGVTAAALALHFRENHVQITYYTLIILGIYGIVQLIWAIREKQTTIFLKNIGLVSGAALIAVGTFIGPLWSIQEYGKYSIRGASELPAPDGQEETGLTRDYAFEYSNGIFEPLVVLIPNFFGGASMHYLYKDPESRTYQALTRNANAQTINQLAAQTSSYWGAQYDTGGGSAPYYGGAIIIFLFVLGLFVVDKKILWWLIPVSVLGIVLSWGDNFASFNYFLFDHLPLYNKFRSPTFTLVMLLFAMPLVGFMGLERIVSEGLNKETKRRLLMSAGIAGGFCLLIVLFAGVFRFTNAGEQQLPSWLLSAMRSDRQSLMRGDAFRSFGFIAAGLLVVFALISNKFNQFVTCLVLAILVIIDMSGVSQRYFEERNYRRKQANPFQLTAADQQILQDKSHYRVFNANGNAFIEARTSYFHNSIGGYHAAKMRRYQDLIDRCFSEQLNQLISDAGKGEFKWNEYSFFNMLNVKYIIVPEDGVLPNPGAAGNAWFVRNTKWVGSPLEELETSCSINPRITAVIDETKFESFQTGYDSAARITLISNTPNRMEYQSDSRADGLAVFSEIYYPEGWTATIDGEEAKILRSNYVLRALQVPAGTHTIVFTFAPKSYVVGDKITMASSWLLLLVILGSLGYAVKKELSD